MRKSHLFLGLSTLTIACAALVLALQPAPVNPLDRDGDEVEDGYPDGVVGFPAGTFEGQSRPVIGLHLRHVAPFGNPRDLPFCLTEDEGITCTPGRLEQVTETKETFVVFPVSSEAMCAEVRSTRCEAGSTPVPPCVAPLEREMEDALIFSVDTARGPESRLGFRMERSGIPPFRSYRIVPDFSACNG